MTHRARNCLPQILVTGTLWTLTGAHRQASGDTSTTSDWTHKHTQTHRPDSSVPAVCQSLCQAACALCWKWCVAQERLSQSMAGSLDSACVLDGCPIRRASTLNCVCLIRKDRTSEMQLRASWTQRTGWFWPTRADGLRAFPSPPPPTRLCWSLDFLPLEA